MLPKYNFSFDICISSSHLPGTIELVKSCPNVSFVLDHIGNHKILDNEFEDWSKNELFQFEGEIERIHIFLHATATPHNSPRIVVFGEQSELIVKKQRILAAARYFQNEAFKATGETTLTLLRTKKWRGFLGGAAGAGGVLGK